MKLLFAFVLIGSTWISAFGQSAERKPLLVNGDDMKAMVLERKFRDVPANVRSFHARGGINVVVDVNEAGQPAKVKVLGPWPKFLTDYVKTAVSEWKFKPMKVDGRPTEYRGVVSIVFWYGSFPEKAPY